MFHFLITDDSRQRHLDTLRAATTPAAVAVFGCFAPDGPDRCSGLPVDRYDPQRLTDLLGPNWALITDTREEHETPAGRVQPFTWAALRRQP